EPPLSRLAERQQFRERQRVRDQEGIMASKKAEAKISSTRAFVPLPGSQRHLMPNSRPAGPVNPSEIISVTVRTRPALRPTELERQIKKIYSQPISKRKYLSHEQLAKGHGARVEDIDAVEQYAQRHNLVVSHRNAAERSLVVTGKLGDLLKAFRADVHEYH